MLQNVPRPEYPRPQFERQDWMNLNGAWTYKINMRPPYFSTELSYNSEEKSSGFEDIIQIPFSPESKLSGVETKEFVYCIFYHRKLAIPKNWNGKKILLHFGAVFYHSEIFIDGNLINFHDGGSSSFTVDISAAVEAGKEHDLVVKATSNLQDGTIPSGKQTSFNQSYKCFYTRTSGIWQTVWMEAVSPYALKKAEIMPNIDDGTLTVTPQFYGIKQGQRLKISVLDGTKTVCEHCALAADGVPITLNIENPILWDTKTPHLYSVQYSVLDSAGSQIDSVSSYAGMRKVHIEGNRFYLNNKPLYQRLVLDQGYYPESQWTAPSDEALKHDIELSLASGFNGARLHQKAFEERFYYWADKLGYLCWGESPSWGLDYNTDGMPPRNFLSEWAELITRDKNHPSIVAWTPLNETFRFVSPLVHRRLHRDAYNLCKSIDPSRPVNDSSGYIHFVTDLWTSHTYEQDPNKLKKQLAMDVHGQPYKNYPEYESAYTGQPYLVDEYGGIKWDPQTQGEQALTHGQNLVSWGYGDSVRSLEEFYRRLEDLTDVILGYEYMCGYCYTQLTDVEQEKNGIYFYDRSAKFDMDRIKAVFNKVPKGFE